MLRLHGLVRFPWPARLSHVVYLVAVLCTLPGTATATGESTNGFPSWQERVIHAWINRARSDPQFEMAACGAACGESACYTAKAPLSYSLPLNRAARFHSDEQLRQNYFAHDSACTVVSDISSKYPATCDGSASCACVGGVKACSPTCTTFGPRVSLFGASPSGEIIASPTDPNQAFYLWLFENSLPATCAFSSSNGHRWLILTSTGAVGAGVSGPAVGDFGSGSAPAKIPSGSHYPRQAASIDIWANWFDTLAPSVARVNIDGACTAMTLKRGTAQNGAFSATLTGLASGCHRYYFEYKDALGAAVTYPTTGSLGIGPAASCPDWDVARAVTCDLFTLAVTKTGTGSGTVTSAPTGISCGADCSEPYIAGTIVTLTAAPLAGSLFTGWSGGGCSGTTPCVVTINADTTITANFFALTVPGAPTLLSATPGNGQATLTFSAPSQNGGTPVITYAALCDGTPDVTGNTPTSPVTLTGMTNGQSYLCSVSATNAIGTGASAGHIWVTPSTGTPLSLVAVKSRKLHGAPPPFDLPVSLGVDATGAVSVEPRFIGTAHTLAFQFNAAIFSTGTVTATDTISGSIAGVTVVASGNDVVVTLPSLPDARRVTITLTNVNGANVNATAAIGFLIGDVNSTGAVNAADISGIKSRLTQSVGAGNFRFDLNASGTVDSTDAQSAKTRSGRVLP
ncbi:MAG: dockerin type I domain-containing protein [Betaproteobacteria bacterium]